MKTVQRVLIALAILGPVLALVAFLAVVNRPHPDDAAVKALRAAKVKVQRKSRTPLLEVILDSSVFETGAAWVIMCHDNKTIDEEMMGQIASLSELEHCSFGRCTLKKGTLQHLPRMQSLRYLWLGSTNFTDRDVRFIANLNRLRSLDVSHTNVSDAAIPELANLEQLQVIYLKGSMISVEGKQRLRALRPDVYIHE